MASGKKCSTQHTLIDIVNRIQLNIVKKLLSNAIFIDLKKAFDAVKTTQSCCRNLNVTESEESLITGFPLI